ncbi:MAG: chaperonin [Flavobacteriaceae bacterium]|nr:chaperonin [Flavobacteriaceae bacterium]
MKQTTLILFLLFNSFMFSQTTITRELGEFNEIKVYDLINVNLIKSEENKVEISGKHSEDVNVIQKNNVLKIRMKLKRKFTGSETNVKIYYKKIDIIDANEGSVIQSKNTINQYELMLRAQEGSFISVKAETKRLEVKSVTGSTVKVEGKSSNQKIKITTGGIYEGQKFTSENTEIDIKTGGKAYVKTNNVLEVKIFSGGDVYIYDTPKQLKQRKVFGGRIMFKN